MRRRAIHVKVHPAVDSDDAIMMSFGNAAGHRGSGDGDSGTSVGDRVLTQLLNELDVCGSCTAK